MDMIRLTAPRECRIEPVGELGERLALNGARLSSPCYRPDAIYTADQAGWPGDWEGRTLLALVSLWNATGAKPPYLDRIIEDVPNHLNSEGYIGPVRGPGDLINEQQLSGHNWLVRGLTEYYLSTGDGNIRDVVLRMVENLYLPLRGQYRDYPLDAGSRSGGGSYAGNIDGAAGQWSLSTDVGCAFMCLDALSQIYAVFGLREVKELLEEMIKVFTGIDLVAAGLQTHATLSATRGILTFAQALGADNQEGSAYLRAAEKVFDVYVRFGMTENYANFNWFGRRDTWTEPCAIVDSLMVAMGLFRLTEDVKYLTLANRIRYNGLGYAQRPNGGFGTDKCVFDGGVDGANPVLSPSGEGISEAFWCCTMRGAEGLAAIARNSVLISGGANGADGMEKVWLPFCSDLNAFFADFSIKIRSELPCECSFSVEVQAYASPVSTLLMIYTPAGIERVNVDLAPGEATVICRQFPLEVSKVRSGSGRFFKYMKGDLILGEKLPYGDADSGAAGSGNEDSEQEKETASLAPLTVMRDLTLEEAGKDRRKILFE
jgi:hypothetical protein